MSTFQQRLNDAIGPCDKVTLSRILGAASSDTIKVQFETIDETLGPLMHPEYIDADNATPGRLVSAIVDAKAHIQSAVEVVTRTRENATPQPGETPDAE